MCEKSVLGLLAMTTLTAEEYAAKHNVPERTVRSWMKMGKIATKKEKRRQTITRTVNVLCIPEDELPPK